MAELNLDTGSIDMILDRKNEYVFLEVNPTGQFGWLSKSCNYYIEKEVAKHMLS
jgi:D-alanine-D-alanine ligase-like ATP-grasp enzyme